MNSIATQNRFDPIPYGSDPQAAAAHRPPSRKMMAMKVGAAALCGAALATKLIASTQANDFGQTRMLAANSTDLLSNQTDPCAEFNTGDKQYVPFDRSNYVKTGLIFPVLFGATAAGNLLYAIGDCAQRKCGDNNEGPSGCFVGSVVCAAVNFIVFGLTLNGYLHHIDMEDGECVPAPEVR